MRGGYTFSPSPSVPLFFPLISPQTRPPTQGSVLQEPLNLADGGREEGRAKVLTGQFDLLRFDPVISTKKKNVHIELGCRSISIYANRESNPGFYLASSVGF